MVRSTPSTSAQVSTRLTLVLGFIMVGAFLLQYSVVGADDEQQPQEETLTSNYPTGPTEPDDVAQAYATLDKYLHEYQEGRSNDTERKKLIDQALLDKTAYESAHNKCRTTNHTEDCKLVEPAGKVFAKSVIVLNFSNDGSGSSNIFGKIFAFFGGSTLVGLVGLCFCKNRTSPGEGGASIRLRRAKPSISRGKVRSKPSNRKVTSNASRGPSSTTGDKSSTGSKPSSKTGPK